MPVMEPVLITIPIPAQLQEPVSHMDQPEFANNIPSMVNEDIMSIKMDNMSGCHTDLI